MADGASSRVGVVAEGDRYDSSSLEYARHGRLERRATEAEAEEAVDHNRPLANNRHAVAVVVAVGLGRNHLEEGGS